MKVWREQVENDFVKNINDTYTLNLAISILEDRESFKQEVERLHSIIKEVREYITYWHYRNDFRTNSFTTGVKEELLKILDKENI